MKTFGSQGTEKRVVYRHFFTLNETRDYCVQHDIDICGVEITDDARNLWSSPFRRSTAFFMGNEGTGLDAAEMSVCDYFLYIPQYKSNTECLNVSVAGSIVLCHFASKFKTDWAGYQESQREGHKFLVDDVTGYKAKMARADEIKQARQNAREAQVEESPSDIFPEA